MGKTLEQIKDEYITQFRFNSWEHFLNQGVITDKDVTEIASRYAAQFQSPTDLATTEICVLRERVSELEDVLKEIHFQYFWNGNDLTIHHKDKIESLINKGK